MNICEDTEKFIIGDRVWVSGTKPGIIAYLGETQFAPGDWAGIVLDEPKGKNDGSVGGVLYFQCESNRGIFSRLNRLSRVPLDGTAEYLESISNHSSSRITSPTTSSNSRISRIPLSVPQSVSSNCTSPAASVISSIAGSQYGGKSFKIGDRIIIKSSQGSKAGYIRYIGTTEFASGEWVGVELDEPRGRNDGTVNGTKYFECAPNFGVFSPISKICHSPLKARPGHYCSVHSGQLKRQNSKESLLSTTSSVVSSVFAKTPVKTANVASTPSRNRLQDDLKNKQNQINQLLKERELERKEVTKAAKIADEAEQKYLNLQNIHQELQRKIEKQLEHHTNVVSRLKTENSELILHLEDEKEKNENLQFRYEEAILGVTCKEASSNLTTNPKITETVEQKNDTKQKQSEIELKLIAKNEQIDLLNKELHNLKEEHMKQMLNLQQTLFNTSDEVCNTNKELQQEISQLKDEHLQLTNAQKQLEFNKNETISNLNTQLSKRTNEYEEICRKNTKQQSEFVDLKNDLLETRENLTKMAQNYENTVQQMEIGRRQIVDLIMEMNFTNDEKHIFTQKCNTQKENPEQTWLNILPIITLKVKEIQQNLTTVIDSTSTDKNTSILEIDSLRKQLVSMSRENESKIQEYEEKINQSAEKYTEITNVLKDRDLEIESVNDTLLHTKNVHQKELIDIQDKFESKTNEFAHVIEQYQKEIVKLKTANEHIVVENNKIVKSNMVQNGEIQERLENEILQLKKTLNDNQLGYEGRIKELLNVEKNSQLAHDEFTKVMKCYEQLKQRLEAERCNLASMISNLSLKEEYKIHFSEKFNSNLKHSDEFSWLHIIGDLVQSIDMFCSQKEHENNVILEENKKVKLENLQIQQKFRHKKVDASTNTIHSKIVYENGQQTNSLLKEKEFAEGQVRFLNSIIADIQKKNEEQQRKILNLESAYTTAVVAELNIPVINHSRPTPRKYCDICEEFDIHETEDCPQKDVDFFV